MSVFYHRKRKNASQLPSRTIELQSPRYTVIPAKAGIQTKDVNLVSLDSRLRGNDDMRTFFSGESLISSWRKPYFPTETLSYLTFFFFGGASARKGMPNSRSNSRDSSSLSPLMVNVTLSPWLLEYLSGFNSGKTRNSMIPKL